jgi:site-specific DNA-methyltransferase (adenine-specific)
MHLIPSDQITILQNRQRKLIDSTSLVELATSIQSIGLIHPLVVRREGDLIILVAGERRLKAIQTIWAMGESFTHAAEAIPEGQVPCTNVQDLALLDAMEMELEENIRRQDLSWQEKAEATSQLFELRRLQAEKRGHIPPTPVEFSREAYPDHDPSSARRAVREELIVARHLSDPDVAAAKTRDEGLKIILRKEETARTVALGERVGRTFSAADHTLLQGDCLKLMPTLPPASFDVILTDPPYGINAQDFNDSGGKAHAVGHTYNDSYDNWCSLMVTFSQLAAQVLKPSSHLYIFCDVDNFVELRSILSSAGFRCFRTPFIWVNQNSQRAPWPQSGPHRKWQMLLYAVRGDRPVTKLAPDVLTYPTDPNLNWAAQKPVALYQDLLVRSCRPGDSVLDPFAGSGTIFPAAHPLKIRATGIELSPEAYGIAIQRLGELK